MTLLELAERCEKAGPDEQRELLEEAHKAIHGGDSLWCQYYSDDIELRHAARWFRNKLDAEAYLDAAMMLVPEGWAIDRLYVWPGKNRARCELWGTHEEPDGQRWHNFEDGRVISQASTPALALTAAALRARSEHD